MEIKSRVLKSYRCEIERTVEQFTAQLMTIDNRERIVEHIESEIGDIFYPNTTGIKIKKISDQLKDTIRLLKLYNKDSFDAKGYENIDFSATKKYPFSDDGEKYLRIFDNAQPIDCLLYLRKDYHIFKNIASKGSTNLYDALDSKINAVWKTAESIKKDILLNGIESDEFLKNIPEDSRKERRFQLTVQLAYQHQEFFRKKEVVVVLEDIKLLYKIGLEIMKGITNKYELLNNAQ